MPKISEMTDEEFTEVCYKRDNTRLKNLLRDMRDSIITKRHDILNHILGDSYDIMQAIEEVDNAIEVLMKGLD